MWDQSWEPWEDWAMGKRCMRLVGMGEGNEVGVNEGRGRHTNLHAGVEGSVHFGFDVDNLSDTEKQKEEKACGGH